MGEFYDAYCTGGEWPQDPVPIRSSMIYDEEQLYDGVLVAAIGDEDDAESTYALITGNDLENVAKIMDSDGFRYCRCKLFLFPREVDEFNFYEKLNDPTFQLYVLRDWDGTFELFFTEEEAINFCEENGIEHYDLWPMYINYPYWEWSSKYDGEWADPQTHPKLEVSDEMLEEE